LGARFNKETKNFQLEVPTIFKLQNWIKPPDAYCMMGFTEIDLYEEDTDLFVAGLARYYDRVSVFSCFRYNPLLKYS